MKKRESFIFYRSFYEAILELPEEDQKNLLLAVANYSLNFEKPKLTGLSKAVWILIKPQLDANNKRFENGLKGGRPKTKTKPKRNQNETKTKPNNNVNVNNNVNDNVNKEFLRKETEWRNKLLKHLNIELEEYNRHLDEFEIAQDLDRPEKELKKHFFNWIKLRDLKKKRIVIRSFDDINPDGSFKIK